MKIFGRINDADLAVLLADVIRNNRHISTVSTGLAVKATGDPDFKTTATAYFEIGGIKYNKTATATIDASAVGNAGNIVTQATSSFRVYVIAIDSGGNFNIYQGAAAASAALAVGAAAWPTVPATFCVIGYFVVTTTTGTYLCGTTNSDASGISIAAAVELNGDKIFYDAV